MIKLIKDKKSWWITVNDQDKVPNWKINGQMLAVTAEEVLDLLNQIKEQQKELLKEI